VFVMSDVDHTGVSVSVKGRHFNQTLGSEFCFIQEGAEFVPCILRTPYNYTYTIPLSRFMPDESILLQFQWVHSYVHGDTHLKPHSHDWYNWKTFVICGYIPQCENCVLVQTLAHCLFLTNFRCLWHKSQESPFFLRMSVWMSVESWLLVQYTAMDASLSNTPVLGI
jgi:hypothetical protein